MNNLLRSVLLISLLFALVRAPAPVAGRRARPARPVATPVECAIKTPIAPRTPGWQFVMNFEKLVNNVPVGCLVFYRSVLVDPVDFMPVTCKLISGGNDIAFADGKAMFDGGYVYCPVNVKAALATFTPSLTIPEVDVYPYFSIIAIAKPIKQLQVTDDVNPIGFYQPGNSSYAPLGMYLPMTSTGGYIVSTFNVITNTGTFTNALETGSDVTILAEHDGVTSTYTTTHYVNNQPLEAFPARPAVTFWTNGGAFWIGASPITTLKYAGLLDEVVFDPPDGGRPPSSPTRHYVYLPVIAK